MSTDRDTTAPDLPAADGKGVVTRNLEWNFLLLTCGEMAAKVCTFVAFSQLARTLGARRYGSLEFVLAVMVFFSLAVDFGLGNYGTREVARNRSEGARYFREIIGLRILLAAGAYAALSVLISVVHRDPEIKQLLWIYGISLFGGPYLVQWFFQAHDRMAWVAAASVLRQMIFAGCALTFRPGMPLFWIGVFECLSVFVTGAFCLILARRFARKGTNEPPSNSPRLAWAQTVRHHWRSVLPIGLAELAWASMWYFATVLFGFLFADATLGWFGASHRVLMALHTFVWLYFFNLLPSISRCSTQPIGVLRDLMKRSMAISVWSSVFVALVLSLLSRQIMSTAFGEEFAGASASLILLVWLLPIAAISGHYRFTLIAYNQQTCLFHCILASAVVAIGAGLFLVPRYGATGAAIALLTANALNLVLVHVRVSALIAPIPYFSTLIAPAVMVFVSLLIAHVSGSAWAGVGIATAGYVTKMAFVYGGRFGRTATRPGAVSEESIAA